MIKLDGRNGLLFNHGVEVWGEVQRVEAGEDEGLCCVIEPQTHANAVQARRVGPREPGVLSSRPLTCRASFLIWLSHADLLISLGFLLSAAIGHPALVQVLHNPWKHRGSECCAACRFALLQNISSSARHFACLQPGHGVMALPATRDALRRPQVAADAGT